MFVFCWRVKSKLQCKINWLVTIIILWDNSLKSWYLHVCCHKLPTFQSIRSEFDRLVFVTNIWMHVFWTLHLLITKIWKMYKPFSNYIGGQRMVNDKFHTIIKPCFLLVEPEGLFYSSFSLRFILFMFRLFKIFLYFFSFHLQFIKISWELEGDCS